MTPESITCPVCHGASTEVKRLSSEVIRTNLARLYEEPSAMQIAIPDYTTRRCNACTLEFANPMLPGDAAFYGWIVKHLAYYPSERWGWSTIRDQLQSLAAFRQNSPFMVMDVGCGGGAFLAYIGGIANLRNIGIDTTASSVAACNARGLEVYCCDIAMGRQHAPGGIDAVTSFHCLEHVPDPVGFVEEAKALLAPNGRIFISTPYSPMSFEETWFDPLNHPPHHLSRWNEKAYEALAARTGLQIRIHLGPTSSLLRRTLWSLLLVAGQAPFLPRPKVVKLALLGLYCLTHPLRVLKEFRAQATRRKVAGRVAPDEILVELVKP